MKRLWMGVMMVGLAPALVAAGPAPAPCDSCAPCAGSKGCGSCLERFLKWLGHRPRYCGSCKLRCDRPTPPLYTFFPGCAEWPHGPHFCCTSPCKRKDVHLGGLRHRLGRGGCEECEAPCQHAKAPGVEKPAVPVAKAPSAPQVTKVLKPAPQVTTALKPAVPPAVPPPAEVVVEAEPEARWFPRIRRWFEPEAEPAVPRECRPTPNGAYARPHDRPWLSWLRGEEYLDPSLEGPQHYPDSHWGPIYQSGHRMFASPTGHGVPGATR